MAPRTLSSRAHVAPLGRQTILDLASPSERALDHLKEGLIDLTPHRLDYSLLVTLPKLVSPDLERLRKAIKCDDPNWGWDALTAGATQIDTPHQRARLAHATSASLLEAVAVSVGVSRTPGGFHIAD